MEGGQLEGASLESLAEDAPAGPIEPEGLGESAPLVEEEVEVSVDRVEVEAPTSRP